jgi:ribosomal protein S18 acetylase RimI-like enzyme
MINSSISGLKVQPLKYLKDILKSEKMDMKLAVREYRHGDFSEVDTIWKATGMGGTTRGDNEKIVENTLQSGGKLFLLENLSASEIIGTSWLTHDGRRIYLHHFGIKPIYQGKGYAKLLMIASMEYARSTGMQIKLEVHRDNLKAVHLYKKWGFKYLGDYDVYIIRDYGTLVAFAG